MELLRRAKLGELRDTAPDRAAFLSCSAAMNDAQRKLVARAFASAQLRRAVVESAEAPFGSEAYTRALLDMVTAKARLGAWPDTEDSRRALLRLMDRAEARHDAAEFDTWLADFLGIRRADHGHGEEPGPEITRLRARSRRLWRGIPPLRRRARP